MTMIKEHVAAAIEAKIEKVNAEIKMYRALIRNCEAEKIDWEGRRQAVMEDSLNEQELRDMYREATGIIILG